MPIRTKITTIFSDDCYTLGGASVGVECVFPFIFDNKRYHSCIYHSSTDGKPWCSTKVDDNGEHISKQGFWGHCSSSCQIQSRGINNMKILSYI